MAYWCLNNFYTGLLYLNVTEYMVCVQKILLSTQITVAS